MLKRAIVAGFIALAAASPASSATKSPGDAAWRKAIVGNWIVPHESADHVDMHDRVREEFRADGTYSVYVYGDVIAGKPDCGPVVAHVESTWRIEDGVLISKTVEVSDPAFGEVGGASRDEILSLGRVRMELRSLDDGNTFVRERSHDCIAGH